MRLHPSLLLTLLAAAPPITAQTRAVSDGWYLGGGAEVLRFSHVAVSDAAPGIAAEVRPSGRAAVHVTFGRPVGAWELFAETGWAGGHIEAANDAVAIQDRSSEVSRYRLALGVTRRVTGLGLGVLAIGVVPALDLWTVQGVSRWRAGAEGRLVLRVPLGSAELENRLQVGLSGNPIEAADVGEVSELRELRTVGVGVGLRFRI